MNIKVGNTVKGGNSYSSSDLAPKRRFVFDYSDRISLLQMDLEGLLEYFYWCKRRER